ncbi:hypothetical protein I4U23_000097 [Adineta vaga]|nr:hypothetical protein I4U23_000097 [Adineta vaga]
MNKIFFYYLFLLIELCLIIRAKPNFVFKTSDEKCNGSCKYSSEVNSCGEKCTCIVQWAGHGYCDTATSEEIKPIEKQCNGMCRYPSSVNQCGQGCFCSAKWAGYGACESSTK